MTHILQDFSLKSLNTFHIDCTAKYFVQVYNVSQLIEFLKTGLASSLPILPLGGGSNILFTKHFEGIVVHLQNKSIDITNKTNEHIFVKASAGENWQEFVSYCVQNNWGGLENLSLIPGNVGSSPIQNIGAYGVEVKDTFHMLEALEIATGKIKTFTKEECAFGYRNSVFKNEAKGKYIILSVTFKLSLNPILNTEYGAISTQLAEMQIEKPTVKDISQAVCAIRNSKLPNPEITGNAGSFFKNPSITNEQAEELQTKYPSIPLYPQTENVMKVAAGWLIEECGWRGHREGNVGVHDKQALVLVNLGNASGAEVFNLAKKIQASVLDKFGIHLEMEVNIL